MILKWKWVLFTLFLGLFIVFAVQISKVTINYDASKYLPDDVQTQKAINVISEEFGLNGYAEIMVSDITKEDAYALSLALMTNDNVKMVEFNPNDELNYKDNMALFKVSFTEGNYDNKTKETITFLENTLSEYDYAMRGEAITAREYNQVIRNEIIKILIFLIPIVLIILFLTTSSWIEPLLFGLVVLVSVIINMGSNIIFDSISYMTHATCGVLQLAICMDYSVMLLHSYRKNRLNYKKDEAIKKALKESFIPIMGSSLTTLVGFMALMTMRYKIGWDVGVVLAKGTIISLISAFLLMPGLIDVFDNLITKTTHKSIFKTNHFTHKCLYKTRYIIPILAIIVIIAAYFVQKNNQFAYSENVFVNESKVLSASNKKIKATFGDNNIISIILPKDLTKEGTLINHIQTLSVEENVQIKSLTSVTIFYQQLDELSLRGFLNSYGIDQSNIEQIMSIFNLMKLQYNNDQFSLEEIMTFINETPALTVEQKQMFAPLFDQFNLAIANLSSNNYNRIILTTDLDVESDKTFTFISQLNEAIKNIYTGDYYLLGESVAIYDIKNVAITDYKRTNILVIFLIALVILISFKSVYIPIILVLLIQGSIWINMSIPAILNTHLLFMGYIIVSCIMLGATIDYAILYANCYIKNREMNEPKEAMQLAYEETKTTVLTSGLILIIAGYTLSFISTIPSIAIFGDLVGRGAIASTLLVLFALPQIMLLCDHLIIKKTTTDK